MRSSIIRTQSKRLFGYNLPPSRTLPSLLVVSQSATIWIFLLTPFNPPLQVSCIAYSYNSLESTAAPTFSIKRLRVRLSVGICSTLMEKGATVRHLLEKWTAYYNTCTIVLLFNPKVYYSGILFEAI
ncbi:unnamed protein product [Cuscuta epithymum]|uniref:Uncharacterized protein n=1 Tax=Cuscuta epithymum TaxID=186058 RepID=A0AAV0CCT2_9ASTE|nr:unnamed protein product [Cuscuta epithymum]